MRRRRMGNRESLWAVDQVVMVSETAPVGKSFLVESQNNPFQSPNKGEVSRAWWYSAKAPHAVKKT